MLTYEDILEKSVDHYREDTITTRLETPKLIVSIVGGPRIYGDFKETFEVAIIDKKTNDFISNKLYPEFCDNKRRGDIMPYLTKEQMLKVVNDLIK
jgi:hypothetical protein